MYDNLIDAHCHIYPDPIAPRAVAAVKRFYDDPPVEPQDGTAGTLIRTGEAAGIRRFVVHSVATKPSQVERINGFIAASAAASGGRFIGLGALHPDAVDPEADFRRLVALGLRGVKLHPDIQGFPVDDPRAMRLFGLCEAAGLPVCVHTGDSRFDFSNPNRVAKVLKAFPKLKFIGAHFGGWSVWDEAARTLADYPNIVVDSSSTFYAFPPDRIRALIDVWTPDRILFGTDYPMWRQQPDIDCLLRLELPDADYQKIFHDNAAALFGVA